MKVSVATLFLAYSLITVAAQDSSTTTINITGVLPSPTDPTSFSSDRSSYRSSVASAASSVESAASSAARSFASAASSIISSVSSVAHTATAAAGGPTGVNMEGMLVGAVAGIAAALL